MFHSLSASYMLMSNTRLDNDQFTIAGRLVVSNRGDWFYDPIQRFNVQSFQPSTSTKFNYPPSFCHQHRS